MGTERWGGCRSAAGALAGRGPERRRLSVRRRLLGLAGPMDRAVFLFFWAVVAPLPAGRGGYDVLVVQVKTQAGNLDLELRERDGTVLYCWSELEDASFCVDVCGKKDLIVRIEGNSYKGNFSLRLLRSQEDRENTP